MDLLSANTKHSIQLHLIPTASVLNAAISMIVSIYANDWNDIILGVGQFSCSGGRHNTEIHGMKALTELYTSMYFVLPGSVHVKKFN